MTIAVAVTAARVAINITEYNHSKGIEQDSFTSLTNNITWTEQGRPIVGSPEDYLGTSVALSADGSILAVGAPGVSGGNGTVGYVKLYMSSDGSRFEQIGADITSNNR